MSFQRRAAERLAELSADDRDESTLKVLHTLRHGTPAEQLFAFQLLLQFPQATALQQALKLINRLSLEQRIEILELLAQSARSKDPAVLSLAQQWTLDITAPLQLKSAAFFYLARQGELVPKDVAMYLDSPNLHLRAAAILAVQGQLQDPRLAECRVEWMLASDNLQELLMGIKLVGHGALPEPCQVLIGYLDHPQPSVRRTAAHAFAQCASHADRRHVPVLLETLLRSKDRLTREGCLRAIGACEDPASALPLITCSRHWRPSERRIAEQVLVSFGPQVADTVLEAVQDPTQSEPCRLLAGKALGCVDPECLRKALPELLDTELHRARFYLFHYHNASKLNPLQDLELLHNTLMSGHHAVIDFVIQMLGAAGLVEDGELLSQALRSRNAKIHGNAVESLEKTCDASLFANLRPLIDDVPVSEQLAHCEAQGIVPLSLPELLDQLEHSGLLADQLTATEMKRQLPSDTAISSSPHQPGLVLA